MAKTNITYNSGNLCSTPKITKCMNVHRGRRARTRYTSIKDTVNETVRGTKVRK